MDDLAGGLEPWSPDPERMEALAEFAAGAGHEINNPLATILGRVQLLLPGEDNPERRRHLETIIAQTLRIRDMIGDLMLFARPPAPQKSTVDLRKLVEQVAQKQRTEIELAGCLVDFQFDHTEFLDSDDDEARGYQADIDRHQISIVVAELLRNARQAMKEHGGTIHVHLSRLEESPPRFQLTVTDPGRGFSAADQKHAFDPFYSGRQAGRGIGFGLCKAWQIVRQHAGTIDITSTPGGPTILRVTLPA